MRRCAIPTACIVGLLSAPGVSCAPPHDPSSSVPRLVVLIVIDQLPASHLERFAPYFGEDGFRRLIREGRLFADARFAHSTTLTAPGHTVIGTGRYGASTGIVANGWFSPETGLAVYSADGPVRESDPTQCARTGSASRARLAPRNPCWVEGTSLARRVKSRWPEARVIGASLKDRAAILGLGEGADAVYWFDAEVAQRFASSAFYRPDREALARWNAAVLPRYVAALDRPGEAPETFAWQFGLPQARATVCPDDDVATHASLGDIRTTYPHPVSSLAALPYTPFGNDLLADFAQALVADLDLGRNPAGQPDVLLLGFSAADGVGHVFGPDSCEVADTMARLDANLAGLLRFLDQRVPKDRSVVLLTSDHGIGSAPEVLRRRGRAAGRVFLSNEDALTIAKLPPARQALEKALAATLRTPIAENTLVADGVVRAVAEPFVYLNPKRAGAAGLPALRALVKTQLEAVDGVADAFTLEEIQSGSAPESIRLAFRAGRSGDLVVVLKPGYIFDHSTARVAASHGQPYDYDAQVPVIVRGFGIDTATVRERVDMARVAPTLASLLDLGRSGFAIPEPLPLFGAAGAGRSTAARGGPAEKSGS